MSKHKTHFLIILILLVGGLLRFYHYAEFPFSGETADEYAWSFLGASLIQEHLPASWSYFSSYEGYRLPIKNPIGSSPLVQPVVDHPPLFSLLPGAFHAMKGNWWEMPSIKLIRFPLIFLGILNLGLLWLVARELLPKPWALVATLVFAIAPSFVFTSRMALAENLLQTWVLLFILVGVQSREQALFKKQTFYFVILSVLALLTKTAGVILPASLLVAGVLQKKTSFIKSGLVSGVVAVAIYLLYGALVNLQLFLSVMAEQSNRLIGLSTLYNRFLIHPSIVEDLFFDGWIVLGLVAVGVVIIDNYKNKNNWIFPISLFISNLFFIALTVGEDTFHAWYDYTWYPILALAISYVAQKIWEGQRTLEAWLLWLMLLPVVRIALVATNIYPKLGVWPVRGLILLGGLPLLFTYFSKEKWSKWAMLGLGTIVVMASLMVIYKMDIFLYSKISNYYFHCEGRCF